MINSRLFSPDDYADIQLKYFAKLQQTGIDADPSGWLSTYSSAEDLLQFPKRTPRDFARYYIDEGASLGLQKERLASLLSAWEARRVQFDEFTLCPSGSAASLVVLAALKNLGIKVVLFETPAYFATIEQAQQIGLKLELIPTYLRDSYAIPELKLRNRITPTAIWLTQPRALLGFNQSRNALLRMAKQMGNHSYMVIDEATDQTFPSHLSALLESDTSKNIFRIRSFTKGMGLNGFRLATILHNSVRRKCITESLETLAGSLDIHSLSAVADFERDIPRFKAMLGGANVQVTLLEKRVEKLVAGTSVLANRLVNGYIGSIVVNLSKLKGRSHVARRHTLLQKCSQLSTPVILGTTSYMAKDYPFEAVRLNYFSLPNHIINGVRNVLSVFE